MLSLMTKRDARSLDHATLEEMRRLAVRRVLAGETHAAIARSLEVHPHTIADWMAIFRAQGEVGLASRKAKGPDFTLSDKQVARLRALVVGKNPRQLNFGPALWSLFLVGELIERLFGVALHKTTVARLLHRIGITPQKPVRRAFARDEGECQRWMKGDFPGIVRAAQRRQATLLFIDETGVHEDHGLGRSWGERGRAPVVAIKGTRRRANVISAISPRGRLWFRCYNGTLTAERFEEFLSALLEDTSRPIELVLDRHPAHTAARVRRFALENKRRLRLHYLPCYAPELNPDEHVWSILKAMFRCDPLEQDEDFGGAVESTMSAIQKDEAKLRALFDHPEVAYVKQALKW